jgi:hypothetical protein
VNVEDFELLLPKAAPDPLVVPRWGVVTQAFPLLVQLAGDVEPLAITPKTMVANLQPGDVVWCVLQGRDLLVVGRIGGQVAARLSKSAQTSATASWQRITLDTADAGVASFADAANGRLVLPSAGLWCYGASLSTDTFSAAHITRVAITNAAATPTAGNTLLEDSYPFASGIHAHTMMDVRPLAAGVTLNLYYTTDTAADHGLSKLALWAYRVA